jgi:tRNA (Thr-GGU) A37 N-methylase
LQVHPGNNPENPIRGVFTSRSPVRPNLIAISETRIISVEENGIEIEDIDALDHSPVLDIKNKKNLPGINNY